MLKKFIVNKDYHNSRFDRWFKQNISNVPQSLIEKLVRKKKIKINRKKVKTSYRVQFNDIVELHAVEDLKSNNKSKKEKYKPSEKEKGEYGKFIIENNDNFIVINKPSGISVQAGTKSFKNIIDILKDTKAFQIDMDSIAECTHLTKYFGPYNITKTNENKFIFTKGDESALVSKSGW